MRGSAPMNLEHAQVKPVAKVIEVVEALTKHRRGDDDVQSFHRAVQTWRGFEGVLRQSRNALIGFEAWNLPVIAACLPSWPVSEGAGPCGQPAPIVGTCTSTRSTQRAHKKRAPGVDVEGGHLNTRLCPHPEDESIAEGSKC
jgi:hypothetical protein